MAARSIPDQVQALLSRQVAEAKVGGAASSDVEAASILETIATNFLLYPRSALVLAFLAKNALVTALQNELTVIETLRQDVNDLGNQTFAVTDTSALSIARVALVQLGVKGSVSVSDQAFTSYDSAVNTFLNKTLSKNVRKPGATDLTRPGTEAGQDLPGDFQSVKVAHADVIDRLSSLTVGVQNFLSSPMSSIISANLFTRARGDLEDIINGYETNDSGSDSRDVAVRLLSARAAIRLFGQAPNIDALLASGVQAVSDPVAPSTTITGPFTLPAGNLNIHTTVPEVVSIPQFGAPGIVSQPLTEPIVIPPNYHLFIQLFDPSGNPFTSTNPNQSSWTTAESGSVIRIPLNSGSSPVSLTINQVIALFSGSGIGAQRFFGTNRIYFYCPTSGVATITVASSSVEPNTQATVDAPSVFTNSGHDLLGLHLGQSGTSFRVPPDVFVSSVQANCVGATATQSTNDVTISAVSSLAGAVLTFSGAWATSLGVSQVVPVSANLNTEVVAYAGDMVQIGSSLYPISSIGSTSLVLGSPIPTYSGTINVLSGLALSWHQLDQQLRAFMALWLKSDYAVDLTKLDRLIAVLIGAPSSPRRNAVLTCLNDIESWLNNALMAVNVDPPPGSAPDEQSVVDGIIETLSERKYDKAVDYLTRCKIFDVFQMDWQTASYAGTMLKAASDLAKTDVLFPDHSRDQDSKVDGLQNKTGYS